MAKSESLMVIGFSQFDVSIDIPGDIWDKRAMPHVMDILTEYGYDVSVQSNDIIPKLSDKPAHTIRLRF